MKHTLTFKSNKSLVRLARDSIEAGKFKVAYCDEYTARKCFFLVKDDGIYLMNCYSGDNADSDLGRDKQNTVVYASGFNPKFNKNCWEDTHSISGDDFAENIYLTDEQLERIANGGNVDVRLSENEIEVRA